MVFKKYFNVRRAVDEVMLMFTSYLSTLQACGGSIMIWDFLSHLGSTTVETKNILSALIILFKHIKGWCLIHAFE